MHDRLLAGTIGDTKYTNGRVLVDNIVMVRINLSWILAYCR